MGDDNTAKSQLLTKAWFNLDKADAPDFKPINISLTPKPTTSTASTAPTNSTALTDSKPKDVFDADEGYDAALGRFMLNHNYFSRRRAIRKFNNQWADTEHYRKSIWENQRQNLLLQQQLNAARTAPVQPATSAPALVPAPVNTRADAPTLRPPINWDNMAKKMGENYTKKDVGDFLTWVNRNRKGNLKIDQKFGTNTQAAWKQYGEEWKKSLNNLLAQFTTDNLGGLYIDDPNLLASMTVTEPPLYLTPPVKKRDPNTVSSTTNNSQKTALTFRGTPIRSDYNWLDYILLPFIN